LGENSKITLEKKIAESKVGVDKMEKMLESLEIFEKNTEEDLLNISTLSAEANAELMIQEAQTLALEEYWKKLKETNLKFDEDLKEETKKAQVFADALAKRKAAQEDEQIRLAAEKVLADDAAAEERTKLEEQAKLTAKLETEKQAKIAEEQKAAALALAAKEEKDKKIQSALADQISALKVAKAAQEQAEANRIIADAEEKRTNELALTAKRKLAENERQAGIELER
jgi:hypothetical protein